MTKSIYVIGGAGTGKSTFTAQLIDRTELEYGPLVDLYSLPNKKNVVTLRGHYLFNPAGANSGLYLGVKRDQYPGTDGLDRASSPVGAAWLAAEFEEDTLPRWVIAEGATLATRPFLFALREYTQLLLVHLRCAPEVAQERFSRRGSNQAAQFVANTVSRSANLARDMHQQDTQILTVDSGSDDEFDLALDLCESFFAEVVARS